MTTASKVQITAPLLLPLPVPLLLQAPVLWILHLLILCALYSFNQLIGQSGSYLLKKKMLFPLYLGQRSPWSHSHLEAHFLFQGLVLRVRLMLATTVINKQFMFEDIQTSPEQNCVIFYNISILNLSVWVDLKSNVEFNKLQNHRFTVWSAGRWAAPLLQVKLKA